VLSLPPSVRIFVATQPVDGRRGVDSLAAIVRSALLLDPLSGHLYVFFSKRCDRVRVVYWDRNGFAMWTKAFLGKDLSRTVQCDGTSILTFIERAGGKRPGCWSHGAHRPRLSE